MCWYLTVFVPVKIDGTTKSEVTVPSLKVACNSFGDVIYLIALASDCAIFFYSFFKFFGFLESLTKFAEVCEFIGIGLLVAFWIATSFIVCG